MSRVAVSFRFVAAAGVGYLLGSLPSGVLAEQVHPYPGEPLSVSPLTWSHATFVAAVLELLERRRTMDACPTCGAPGYLREQGRARHAHGH